MGVNVQLAYPRLISGQNLNVITNNCRYIHWIANGGEDCTINNIKLWAANGNPFTSQFTLGNGINPIRVDLTFRTNRQALILEQSDKIMSGKYLDFTFINTDNIQPNAEGKQIIQTKNANKVILLWDTTAGDLFLNGNSFPSATPFGFMPITLGDGFTKFNYDIDISGTLNTGIIIQSIEP